MAKKNGNGLTLFQGLFVEAYLANGGNGTRAYLAVHPEKVSTATAASESWKLLRIDKVKAKLEERKQEKYKALAMSGDEAIALLSLRARANLADGYDAHGKPLPFHQWPESLQLAVRSHDGHKTTLYDALRAAQLMAMATGRLKTVVDLNVFDHETYVLNLDDPPAEGER